MSTHTHTQVAGTSTAQQSENQKMKYANEKTLIAAIRKLEKTQPKDKIKGVGNVRFNVHFADLLADIVGKNKNECNHICTVFARRSTKAKYNRMQFGCDEDFVSTEMNKIITENIPLLTSLCVLFNAAQRYKELVK